MRVGEGFVPGRSKETARQLLAAAREAGVDEGVVRTSDDGYIVPKEVLDVFQSSKDSTKKTSGAKGNRVKRTTKASKERSNG